MNTNPLAKLSKPKEEPAIRLLAVTPPRTGSHTMLGAENMLASIAVPEPFSLEIAGDSAGVTLLARCRDGSFVKQQLGAHYPQALVDDVPPEEDPLRLAEGEQAWSLPLRLQGPEYLPLRTFRDDALLDQGSDPLIALIGSMSDLEEGERIVARVRLNSLGPDWAQAHLAKMMKKQEPDPANASYTYQTRPLQNDGIMMAVLGLGALGAIQGYLWYRGGEVWKSVLLGLGVSAGLAFAGWAYWRIKKARSAANMHDPVLIKEKVSRLAFEAELEVTAILSEHGTEARARELLRNVAAAYHHYDNAAGARFKVGKVRPALPYTGTAPPRRGLLQSRNVLGVRELAALWHPLNAGDEMPMVARSGAKVLLPSSKSTDVGAHVGDTTAGKTRKIHFTDDLLGRNHLYIARTRMGKSTLMLHDVVHMMREKAVGRNPNAIIVIDPHADLVAEILEHVPPEIADKVWLIDLAQEERAPGINLLDAHVFPDRDRTADSVVRVARGLWDQWGPRMQSILEHTVKSLHEANAHPSTKPEEQYTILDALEMLTQTKFRNRVLKKVSDPYLLGWWARDFGSWHRQYKAEALAPVQTRLGYYASSKRARAILGQPRSTIDIRQVIRDGGILLVSTAQGTVGRDVSALVGASILNLVDSVIREQGSLPPEERRGAMVVVDEMQSIPGVDYEAMLSELGKFGASFVLATQSLAKLKDLSSTMQDTLLANVGCLAVFQVAASDARQLVWELNRDRLSEEDIASLPVHHCYVRATVGNQRLATFSMAVKKPEPGDPEIARRIREESARYTTSAETIASREADAELLLEEFRKGLDELEQEEGSQKPGSNGASKKSVKPPKNRKQKEDNGPQQPVPRSMME